MSKKMITLIKDMITPISRALEFNLCNLSGNLCNQFVKGFKAGT
jgi:hypothetical protein